VTHTFDGGRQQAALDRVVVDDEDGRGHVWQLSRCGTGGAIISPLS
jgi:hypothetical protein